MKNTKLDKLLSDFYTVSGMETSVLDADFHTVAMARFPGRNFCSLIHRAEGAGNICKGSDIERLLEVRSSLRPIVYTCPFGITEAIFPIIRGDAIVAYIISSMGVNTDLLSVEDAVNMTLPLARGIEEEKLSSSLSLMNLLKGREIDAYLSFLGLLSEHIGNDETIVFGTESIGKLCKSYIKNNLSEKLTLSDIARNLHCSTVTLTEHFKAEFGITIIEYVTRKRMQLSEKLLITTDRPLREIAQSSGFPDVEYFSRTFKKFHGISPAEWRKREKKEDGSK